MTSFLDDDTADFDEDPQDDSIYQRYERDIESISQDLGLQLEPLQPQIRQPEPDTGFEQVDIPIESSYALPQQQQYHIPQPQQYQMPPQPQYHMPPQQQYHMPQPPPQPQYYAPPPRSGYTHAQKQYYEDDEVSGYDEDEKLYMLEKIKHMAESLERIDMADVDELPTVSRSSSMEEIKSVHGLLVRKMNRIRYTEFGKTAILGCAKMLGSYFDGDNEFMGRKINLTGLDVRLEWKLNHLGPTISDIAQRWCSRIDPAVLTGLEIASLVVMHSHDNANTVKKDSLYDD